MSQMASKSFAAVLSSEKSSASSGCSVMAESMDVSCVMAGKNGFMVSSDPCTDPRWAEQSCEITCRRSPSGWSGVGLVLVGQMYGLSCRPAGTGLGSSGEVESGMMLCAPSEELTSCRSGRRLLRAPL